jgi:hypothetical protein
MMVDSDMHDSNGDQGEWEGPRPGYEIIAPAKKDHDDNFIAEGHLHASDLIPHPEEQNAASEPATPDPPLLEAGVKPIKKFATSSARVIAAIGVGLGLLVGIVLAAIFWHPGGKGGQDDLGSINSSAYGLKGHLTMKWGDRLEYHLTVEPSDPGRHAAFAFAVINSPRPLALDIQLKDPFGAVLCGNTIVVPYDPRKATPVAASDPESKTGNADRGNGDDNQVEQGVNLARLESQEIGREHGKDIFQDDVGPDGQVASISAQGNLPCTKKQYDNTASWSFTPTFPTVAEQDELLNPGSGLNENGNPSAGGDSSSKTSDALNPPASKKIRRVSLPPPSPIYIEGDDAIVGYDASMGILETSAGKAFAVDRTDAIAIALKGRDFPIDIHYRCDQTGACTFAGSGLGVQHAKLRR